MELAYLVLGILVGGLLGGFINSQFQLYDLRKILYVVKKELARAYEEGIKYGAVQPKIERINEISKEQIGYMGALDRPNASAAHSRHKNSIISLIKKLEEEKISIFQSILDSGSDPVLTITLEGKLQSLKTSEILAILQNGGVSKSDKTPEEKTDSNSPRGAKLRLITSEENKDAEPTDTSDPKVH